METVNIFTEDVDNVGFRVTGYWLLVTGYWLLVTGYWLLVTGFLLQHHNLPNTNTSQKPNSQIRKFYLLIISHSTSKK
jgi:hypothetical protein